MVLKIVPDKSPAHIGCQVFPVEEVLAVTGTNADDPVSCFVHDLSGEPPDQQPQRHPVEARVRWDPDRAGVLQIAVQDLLVALSRGRLRYGQQAGGHDHQQCESEQRPCPQAQPAPLPQIDEKDNRQ